jgi:hypothetical protein
MMVWKLVGIAAGVVLLLAAINRVPLKYTLRNLTVRWKTTALTALAFTLVIGVLVVMLAFVNGMQKMTDGTGQPGNVLVMSDGRHRRIVQQPQRGRRDRNREPAAGPTRPADRPPIG